MSDTSRIFYFQLLYQVTEVGLFVIKTLNKFRIKLESLVCSLKTCECLLCDRPCALGMCIGDGTVMHVTAPPTRTSHPAQDGPGWAVKCGVTGLHGGACVSRRGGG